MPNALEILADDHRRVEDLFDQFHESGDEAVAMEICDELTVHARVEEQLVYPELRRLDEALEQESETEHNEAKALIERVRSTTGDELVALVDQLEQAIEHHVSEEETKAFPVLAELGDDRLDAIGEEITQAKVGAQRA